MRGRDWTGVDLPKLSGEEGETGAEPIGRCHDEGETIVGPALVCQFHVVQRGGRGTYHVKSVNVAK